MDGKNADQASAGPLKPDATFRFSCRMCGSCCRDNRYIILTPQDIFLLSRHFSIASGEFLSTYCDVEREAGLNGVPLASLRTPGGACVFHRDNLCAVHTARPASCRNYPVGTALEPQGAMWHELMAPAPGCRGFGNGPPQTVQNWWRDARMDDVLAGIELAHLAAQAVTRRLSAYHKEELFRILCDFDSLEPAPGQQKTQDFGELLPRLRRRLQALLEKAPPLRKA